MPPTLRGIGSQQQLSLSNSNIDVVYPCGQPQRLSSLMSNGEFPALDPLSVSRTWSWAPEMVTERRWNLLDHEFYQAPNAYSSYINAVTDAGSSGVGLGPGGLGLGGGFHERGSQSGGEMGRVRGSSSLSRTFHNHNPAWEWAQGYPRSRGYPSHAHIHNQDHLLNLDNYQDQNHAGFSSASDHDTQCLSHHEGAPDGPGPTNSVNNSVVAGSQPPISVVDVVPTMYNTPEEAEPNSERHEAQQSVSENCCYSSNSCYSPFSLQTQSTGSLYWMPRGGVGSTGHQLQFSNELAGLSELEQEYGSGLETLDHGHGHHMEQFHDEFLQARDHRGWSGESDYVPMPPYDYNANSNYAHDTTVPRSYIDSITTTYDGHTHTIIDHHTPTVNTNNTPNLNPINNGNPNNPSTVLTTTTTTAHHQPPYYVQQEQLQSVYNLDYGGAHAAPAQPQSHQQLDRDWQRGGSSGNHLYYHCQTHQGPHAAQSHGPGPFSQSYDDFNGSSSSQARNLSAHRSSIENSGDSPPRPPRSSAAR